MATTYYDQYGNKVTKKQYTAYTKQLKQAQKDGVAYQGEQLYTAKDFLAAVGTYYTEAGKALTAKQTADYLSKLHAAETTGTAYTGTNYYTGQELSDKYGGYSLDIIKALGKRGVYLTEAPKEYTVKGEDELRSAAENRYAMTYGLQQTAAQNQRDANILALEQQRPEIERNYDAQLTQSNKQYASAYDTLNGAMLSRGLARSSYAGALAGNQLLARNNAANGISSQRTSALNDLQNRITQENTNYNNTIYQMEANKSNEIAAYMDTLRQQEFANQQQAAGARIDYLTAIQNLPKGSVKSTSGSSSKSSTSTGGGTTATNTTSTTTSTKRTTDDMINGK